MKKLISMYVESKVEKIEIVKRILEKNEVPENFIDIVIRRDESPNPFLGAIVGCLAEENYYPDSTKELIDILKDIKNLK